MIAPILIPEQARLKNCLIVGLGILLVCAALVLIVQGISKFIAFVLTVYFFSQ